MKLLGPILLCVAAFISNTHSADARNPNIGIILADDKGYGDCAV